MVFGKFSLGRAGKLLVYRGGAGPLGGGLQSRGGAKDFDEFCKNVIWEFLKIEETFYPIFPFYVS